MSNWSEQLQDIGFEKTKQADGAVSFHYQASHRRASFWTQITVKQVGRPSPDSWQVTYSRAELQIGIWKIHNAVKNMDVIVYTNDGAMINDIQEKMQRKANSPAKNQQLKRSIPDLFGTSTSIAAGRRSPKPKRCHNYLK